MTVALRVLDDGAWISVNDARVVPAAELWPVFGWSECTCQGTAADFLAEGFVEVGADGRTVDARVYGRCIACGSVGTTDWLSVGRIVDGEFRHLDRRGGLRPVAPSHPASENSAAESAGDD